VVVGCWPGSLVVGLGRWSLVGVVGRWSLVVGWWLVVVRPAAAGLRAGPSSQRRAGRLRSARRTALRRWSLVVGWWSFVRQGRVFGPAPRHRGGRVVCVRPAARHCVGGGVLDGREMLGKYAGPARIQEEGDGRICKLLRATRYANGHPDGAPFEHDGPLHSESKHRPHAQRGVARLACRLSPAIQSIRRPARLTVITFRFMDPYDDLYFAGLPALFEGISQITPSCSGSLENTRLSPFNPPAADRSPYTTKGAPWMSTDAPSSRGLPPKPHVDVSTCLWRTAAQTPPRSAKREPSTIAAKAP